MELAPPNSFLRPGAPTGILITVVCRTGRAVITANELQWASAWRFSNHVTDAHQGSVFAMTPHGWISDRHRAGLTPVLDEHPPRAALRVVP